MNTHTPEYKQWLSSLRVGDTRCHQHSWHDRGYEMMTIKLITPTQAVCVGSHMEKRFRLADGKVIGNAYRYVEPVTDAVRKVNHEVGVEAWFEKLSHGSSPPLHVIEAMKAAYDKAMDEAPAS